MSDRARLATFIKHCNDAASAATDCLQQDNTSNGAELARKLDALIDIATALRSRSIILRRN